MHETDPDDRATTPIETNENAGSAGAAAAAGALGAPGVVAGDTEAEGARARRQRERAERKLARSEAKEATEPGAKPARAKRRGGKQPEAGALLDTTAEDSENAENAEETGKRERFSLSGLSGKRLVLVIAGVAVFSLLAGIGVMQFIVSPAELAARTAAPKGGLITVPIEERRIENTVTSRADVTYADAVPVKIETGGLSGPAVVSGQVPKAGAEFQATSIALEVAGRPVIVLPGELPAYRTLSIGLSGPDVTQLKQALISIGIDAGDPDSNVYDAGTAAGVAALYERVGYAPPATGEDAADGVRSAEQAVRDAQTGIQSAQAALAKAQQGPNESERLGAENAVREAERALQREQQTGKDPFTIAQLQDALNLAVATRNELGSGIDVAGEQAALQAANTTLESAQADLVRAQEGAMATLPSSEVLFLTALPRRVDDITVDRGSVLEGTAMTVSGAKLVLSGTVSASDAELLKEGQEATFDGPKGEAIAAKVVKIAKVDEKSGDSGTEGNE
ncbi:hypothetical protein, partial [Leucobacter sp. M11]|uniref:hypothetical protein n=1 Tax=Leucobacter sp. M11 TaxID=2993565 RepID=UPI002D7FF259